MLFLFSELDMLLQCCILVSNDVKASNNKVHPFGRESWKLLDMVLNSLFNHLPFLVNIELALTSTHVGPTQQQHVQTRSSPASALPHELHQCVLRRGNVLFFFM